MLRPLTKSSTEEVQEDTAGAEEQALSSAWTVKETPALDAMLRCGHTAPPQPELEQLLNRLSDH